MEHVKGYKNQKVVSQWMCKSEALRMLLVLSKDSQKLKPKCLQWKMEFASWHVKNNVRQSLFCSFGEKDSSNWTDFNWQQKVNWGGERSEPTSNKSLLGAWSCSFFRTSCFPCHCFHSGGGIYLTLALGFIGDSTLQWREKSVVKILA